MRAAKRSPRHTSPLLKTSDAAERRNGVGPPKTDCGVGSPKEFDLKNIRTFLEIAALGKPRIISDDEMNELYWAGLK